MKTGAHPYAVVFSLFLTLSVTACGMTVPQATTTATSVPTSTNTALPTLTPTVTQTPTKTPVPTSTPNFAATQQYEGFSTWVGKLIDEGIIPSKDGDYHAVEDFSKAYAKQAYFTWKLYDNFSANNFIVQARARITNATTENVFKSGCGLIFADIFDAHALFFSLDGNANYRIDGADRGSKYIDSALFQNPDGVMLTMVLYNHALRFYVNDQMALSGITIYGGPFQSGPAILSGTSEGFGTQCDFTETVLWRIR
ncbi:MAG TPA: hypothetical protein PKL78_01330 [Anaerolineales bacterium]|nr:hypothetical protein [Anaerolineales bacterium]HNN12168.1 hypothetical protein [Anaerolineales bacterium]